ncbi:glycosyltransferase family 4 protein [Mycoplasmatota bacterium]|nr:glycosyltransferase family 4 protein [Mycoplasmatota bacterium]
MEILIIANSDTGLYGFRKDLILELNKLNCNISVATSQNGDTSLLEDLNCKLYPINIKRRSLSILNGFLLLIKINTIINITKPDLIITYTIKPNIIGGILARFKRINYVANITGLGSAFNKSKFLKSLALKLNKFALKKADKVFFENLENKDFFIKNRVVISNKAVALNGAGVNLEEYSFHNYPKKNNEVRFLFIGRIMKEKGIEELFDAIVGIKKLYPNVQFDIVGKEEENYRKRIDFLVMNGYLNFHGYQKNIIEYVSRSSCVILPSYHEGMSNVLLEAAAIGRPLITSNIPGCKEAVINNQTGFLVDVRDTEDLTDKIINFITLDYEKRKLMGLLSRKHIEEFFDKKIVVEKTIQHLAIKKNK